MVAMNQGLEMVRLALPATHEDLSALNIGTIVYLDGIVYTGREGVYKRVIEDGFELSGLARIACARQGKKFLAVAGVSGLCLGRQS